MTRASDSIADWLLAASRLPAHDLLDRIDAELDIAARYAAAMPADRRLRANLGALIQQVLNIDQGRYPTLGRLNRELARLAVAGKDAPDEAPPATADAVRVMTVHASKGLEAPAVFLVNTAPKASERDAGWLVDWPSEADRPRAILLVGARDQRDPRSAELIAAKRTGQDREALNLLYVAATRARQYLFVSAFSARAEDRVRKWHRHAAEAMTALIASQAHGQASPLPGAPDGTLAIQSGVFPVLPLADSVDARPQVEEMPALRRRLPAVPRGLHAPSLNSAARDPDAVLRGRAIHWLIEQLALGRPLDGGDLIAQLETQFAETVDPEAAASWLAEARGVIGAAPLAMLFDPARLVRAWNEVPVQWQADDGRPRSGVIDRLLDDGERLWIVDYKTAPRPDAAALTGQHRGQLEAYAEAIGKVFPGREIRAGLVLTATARWLPLLDR